MNILSYGHILNKVLVYLKLLKSAGGYIFALEWSGSLIKSHSFNFLAFEIFPINMSLAATSRFEVNFVYHI